MRKTEGYALLEPGGELLPWQFDRRELRPDDVAIRITFCGVCHSDLHMLEAMRDGEQPLVPGHEFVGEVAEVGAAVSGFVPGDTVAVGNIVDSCGVCEACLDFEEPACAAFPTLTYGGRDNRDGLPTRGAYSREYVATERFVHPLPPGLDPAAAAPLMCAGLTTWDPLRKNGTGPGDRVGVVGLGGLGHMAVKFAVALGADVTVFTTSQDKREAAQALGADAVLSTDAAAMARVQGTFDLILDTVPVKHDPTPYLHAVRRGGTVCMLGLPDRYEPEALSLLGKRLTASGSAGTRSTSEMLAFCGEHALTAEVEVLPLKQVATALERLARNDVRYRFVLDVASPGG